MRTHYTLQSMRQGRLISEMYSTSDAAEAPDVARQLAHPTGQHDAVALVRVETAPSADGQGYHVISRIILEIVS